MSTTRQMVRLINKVVAPLQRRVMLTAARAYLLFFDDTTKAQVAQAWLLDGETRDAVERFQEYGFTSVPGPEGCEGAVIFVAGNRAHGIIVATEDRNLRPTGLNQGDVALYNSSGIRVYLDENADVVNLGAQAAAAFVARVGDKTVADVTMATWVAAVTTFINGLAPGTLVSPTDFGAINTGASKVKAT